MKVFAAQIDTRCGSGTPWGVVDTDTQQLVACHLIEDDARRDASNRMAGTAIAGGLGVAQDLPGVTPATGGAATAPMSAPAHMANPAGPYQMDGRAAAASDEIEHRSAVQTWPMADLELRSAGDGMHFTGYAAVFDVDSLPRPYVETIAPGAFSRSLKADRDIRMYLNHDLGKLLATRKAGTLRLTEDKRGLLVDADLPDTTDGHNTAELIKRGDIAEMSFTFKKGRDTWSEGGQRRRLDEVKLFEVSPMTEWAGYDATSVSVRALGDLARAALRQTKEGRGWSESASNAATGAGILQNLLYLLSSESDEPEQMAMIQSSIDSLQRWMAAEQAEVGTTDDAFGMNALKPRALSTAKARLELLAASRA